MDQHEPKKIPLMTFIGVSVAPFLAFVLANVLFLPIAMSMINFSDSFLAELLYPINNPLTSRLVMVLFMLLLPITAIIVLVSPPLTSFLVNRRLPVLTNTPRVLWSAGVFFLLHSILLTVLLVYRSNILSPLPTNYPFFRPAVDPLLIFGVLSGFLLSFIVALFGWLGARRKLTSLRTRTEDSISPGSEPLSRALPKQD